MRTFWSILKNNYRRTVPRTTLVIVMTAIILASIVLAVYITRVQQVKGHIAFITQNTSVLSPQSSKYLSITVLSQKPPYSDLVKQKYDAYVTADPNGNYQVETLRSSDYKKMILLLLNNPDARIDISKTDRGIGVNIIGFMMMFLLMLAFGNLFAFAEDKEQGQLRRIAASPASFGWYLAAHCIYCLSLLAPEFIILAILQCCGWNIGFTLLQYMGLMTVLGFLGISFALLLNSLIPKPDNAAMLGNSLTVLTSVLAGSFYSFSKNNDLLDGLIKMLPQREIMDFAQDMQNGQAWQNSGSILYTIGFSLVLFLLSCLILRHMYVKKV
jgi:ABC-2 type transport system permease protein